MSQVPLTEITNQSFPEQVHGPKKSASESEDVTNSRKKRSNGDYFQKKIEAK